jgi:hypothetical protein
MQKTINILFLDDMEERTAHFCKVFMQQRERFTSGGKDFDLRAVPTADLAVAALKEKHWDFITLDHDLGGQTYVPSGDDTGYAVAKAISEDSAYDNQTVFIHSWNPDGVKNMQGVLKKSMSVPFGTEYPKMVVDFLLETM